MENKEEFIEEIKETEDVIVQNNATTSESNGKTGVLDGIDVDAALNGTTDVGNEVVSVSPSKGKTLLIVLLSSLLAIDVVALIIYIIGIDKVLTFIK